MRRGSRKYITKEDRGPVLLEEVVYETQDGPIARLKPLAKLLAPGPNDRIQDGPAGSTSLPPGGSANLTGGTSVAEIYYDGDSLVVNDMIPQARKGKVCNQLSHFLCYTKDLIDTK